MLRKRRAYIARATVFHGTRAIKLNCKKKQIHFVVTSTINRQQDTRMTSRIPTLAKLYEKLMRSSKMLIKETQNKGTPRTLFLIQLSVC